MRNLAVCVPSKGRPMNVIFRHLKLIDPRNVYVYVHFPEHDLYKSMYPEFNIVGHDCGNIGEIRSRIQEHQHSLGNNYISLDDDVWGFMDGQNEFQVSLPFVYDRIAEAFTEDEDGKSYDIIDLHFHNQKPRKERHTYEDELSAETYADITDSTAEPGEYEKPPGVTSSIEGENIIQGMSAVAYAIAPSLKDKGITFTTGAKDSEDFEMTIALMLNKERVRRTRLPFGVLYNFNDADSSFGTHWYNCCLFRLYAKYGRLFKLNLHLDQITLEFQEEYLEEYKAEGRPVYSRLSTKWIEMFCPGTTEERLAKEEALQTIRSGRGRHKRGAGVRNRIDRDSVRNLIESGTLEEDEAEAFEDEIAAFEEATGIAEPEEEAEGQGEAGEGGADE